MAVQQTLTLTQLSQNTESSTVRILWKSTQTAGSYNLTERTARYWVDTGSGEQEFTVTYKLNRVSTDTIVDTTVTVPHDAAGHGTLRVRTWMDTRISAGVVELNEVLTLTPIPRISAVSVTGGLIGGTAAVVIYPTHSSCIHTLRCRFGTLEFWVDAEGNGVDTPQFLTARTVNLQLTDSFYSQLPDSTRGQAELICTTYRDGELLGARTAMFQVEVDRVACGPVLTAAVADCNPATLALTGDAGVLVRGMSHARCTAAATAAPGAQITSIRVGNTDMPAGEAVLTDIPAGDFTFRVTDSRGLTGECTVTVPLIPYVQLTANAAAVRTDPTGGTARLTVTGSCYAGAFGKADNSLKLTCSVNGEAPFSMTALFDGSTYTATAELTGLDYTQSHWLAVTAADGLQQVSRDVILQPGIPVFDWGAKDFRFNVPVSVPKLLLPEGPIADQVVERGHDGIWHWQKWASGLALCSTSQVYTVPDVAAAWGGLYRAAEPSPRLAYPIGFWESPVEAVTVRPSLGANVTLTVAYNTASETGVYSFLTDQPVGTEQQVTVDYYVTGYWKIPEEEIL